MDEAVVHCAGEYILKGSYDDSKRSATAARRTSAHAWDPKALYNDFSTVGLQYGPAYQTLAQAWNGADALARLQARATNEGTQVHPADLDDALCTSALIPSSSGGGGTRLPFAVDQALLQGAPGELWAAVRRQSTDAVSVYLGASSSAPQAQLDGFKSRTLRSKAPVQRDVYVSGWLTLDASDTAAMVRVLVIGDGDDKALFVGCEWLSPRGSSADLATKLSGGDWVIAASATATQRASGELTPLFALAAALVLVQAQASSSPAFPVWLLTTGAQLAKGMPNPAHAGSWGLGRSARSEASLPLQSIDSVGALAVERGLSLGAEPEGFLHEHTTCVPRLKTAPPLSDGLVRLHFHSRGAISNLFIEPLPPFAPLSDFEVRLRIQAAGLNFRDVLNVLGEYPGEPGPPGGDAAGVVGEASSCVHPSVGLGYAPLASASIASALSLVGGLSAVASPRATTARDRVATPSASSLPR